MITNFLNFPFWLSEYEFLYMVSLTWLFSLFSFILFFIGIINQCWLNKGERMSECTTKLISNMLKCLWKIDSMYNTQKFKLFLDTLLRHIWPKFSALPTLWKASKMETDLVPTYVFKLLTIGSTVFVYLLLGVQLKVATPLRVDSGFVYISKPALYIKLINS